MLKIFLVEDEIVIREGIRNNVDWEKEGLSFVGCASDGEMDYPAILKEKPDILITDIRMPFMDGLELSRLLRKDLPGLKIIIISGYREFEYAQKAIDLGVTEYLLKPFKASKLLEVVRGVAQNIEKERQEQQLLERYRQEMDKDSRKARTELFRDLISGHFSVAELLEKGKKLGIELGAPIYQTVLFQLLFTDAAPEYTDKMVQAEEDLLSYIQKLDKIEAFEREIDGWFFIVRGDSEEELKERLDGLCHELAETVRKAAGGEIHFFGGIGRIVYRLRDLKWSYNDANKALSFRYFEKPDQILFYKSLERESTGTFDVNGMDMEKIDAHIIENFLRNGIEEEVENFVDGYLSAYGDQNISSMIFCHYVTMHSYLCVLRFQRSIGNSEEEVMKVCGGLNEEIGRIASREAMREFMIRLFGKSMELRNHVNNRRYGRLIRDAKEYIQKHCQESDLNLNKVASTVNISTNYFSSIFAQETGQTFTEYLTGTRMKLAKELLRCTNKKITEIGELAGYQDSHYFSYIFKKTQNCTPKEYRMKGMKE